MSASPASEKPAPPLRYGAVAAHGAVWLGSAQIIRVLLTIVSTIVIARILSPGDYGVIAMVAPVLALGSMFQDLGLSTATIQATSMTPAESNALFWLNATVSAALAVFLVALAPAVSLFYGDVRAGYATAALGGGFIITGAAAQHAALINRDLRFAALAQVEIAGLLTTYAASILLAFALHSYWALVLGTLAGNFVQCLLFWRASSFRPMAPKLRGAGALVRVGGHVTGFNLLNFLVRNLDDVLVARFAGAVAAGLYDRSYRLMMMPLQNINGPLSRLLQPLLGRLQDEPERYRRVFTMAARGTMLAIAPGVAVAALFSDRLMPWLLGERWAAAGPIFFWLGLTGLIQPISNLTGILFITRNRTRDMMYWGIISGIITVAAFAVGIRWGALGIAQALFFSALLRVPMLYFWSARDCPVRAADLYSAQILPLIGAVGVAAAALYLAGNRPFLPVFIGAVAAAYPAAFLTSCMTRRGRETTLELARLAIEYGRARLRTPTVRNA